LVTRDIGNQFKYYTPCRIIPEAALIHFKKGRFEFLSCSSRSFKSIAEIKTEFLGTNAKRELEKYKKTFLGRESY
jgi:hypothetical protein